MDIQRKAIKTVLSQSIELRRKLMPFIAIQSGELREIDFNQCLDIKDLSPGLRSAIVWMQAIWIGKSGDADLIALSFLMEPKLRIAILKALKIIWSLE